MIVVDSSTALKWLLPETGTGAADRLRGLDLAAPDIIFTEVANVLARKVRSGELSRPQAHEGLALVAEIIHRIEPTRPLIGDAVDLSTTLRHPVYDCLFLACAIELDGSLATHDEKVSHSRHRRRLLNALHADAAVTDPCRSRRHRRCDRRRGFAVQPTRCKSAAQRPRFGHRPTR